AIAFIIYVPIHGHILVKTPARRYMIDDDIADAISSKGIITTRYVCTAPAETHVSDHHIVGVDPEGLACDADTISGCRLACNRNVWSTNNNRTFQLDNPCHVKYNDTGSPLLTSLA